jgi:hypothetical protein
MPVARGPFRVYTGGNEVNPMKARSSPLVAAATALALCVQSTGAASIPAAMLPSAGTFPPSAARFGASPAARLALSSASAKKAERAPAGPSWLESAKIVSDFVLDRAREALDPAPPPAALPAEEESARIEAAPVPISAPVVPEAVITPLNPGVDSPRDRMMVVMEPGRRVEAVIDNNFRAMPHLNMTNFRLQKTIPPFREKAIESNGVRARLSYLGAHGTVLGGPAGWTISYPGETPYLAPAPRLPAAYQRNFPIYFSTEEIEISVTVENRSGRTLTGVRLEAVQEIFFPSGTEGTRILPPKTVPVAASLAPGEKAVVHWRTRLMGPADKPMNDEQTHVRILADGQAAPLLDAPQAGVVDPPGPGLL